MKKQPDNHRRMLAILFREHSAKPVGLDFSTPFELLIATMLSQQCTDARVNKVTPRLFKTFPSVASFAEVPIRTLERAVYSTGFYRTKARHIREVARIILHDHDSEVPSSMPALMKLPGVARKTANIVLSKGFGIVEGIAVDTHVRRLAYRLGFTRSRSQNRIEKDLMKIVPRAQWTKLTDVLISHGREVCRAQSPHCHVCCVSALCPSSNSFSHPQ